MRAKAFGFQTISIDGHDFDQIEKAFEAFHACNRQAYLHPDAHHQGQGVSSWKIRSAGTAKAPNDEEYKQAMEELNAAMAELEAAK